METNELMDETLSENALIGAIMRHIVQTCESNKADFEVEISKIFKICWISLQHQPTGSTFPEKINSIWNAGILRQFAALVSLWEMGMKKGA